MTQVRHEFVEFIPQTLEPGVVYISIPYTTITHLCCCGCGNKVVNPISPAQWRVEYDGETVSVSPSVGSWDLPCRSHYWIWRNQIRWARPWTDEEISLGRHRDKLALERQHGATFDTVIKDDPNVSSISTANLGFLKSWLGHRRS